MTIRLLEFEISQSVMKRFIDLSLAMFGMLVFAIPMLLLAVLIKLTSNGPILYWCERVGRGDRNFSMPKFRTMRTGTPQLATHLLNDADGWLTPIGRYLRSTSLDEIPQLWSIFKGDMSFVGPRPALFNQDDLIELRTQNGVDQLTPGLTGWAQVNGRDELPIPIKVDFDKYYLQHRSVLFDLRILFLTVIKVVRRDGFAQAGEERSESDESAHFKDAA